MYNTTIEWQVILTDIFVLPQHHNLKVLIEFFKWLRTASRAFSKQSFSWINYCLMLHTFWRETLRTNRTQTEKWKWQSIFVLSLQTITFKTSSNVAIKFLTWCFALNAVCLCVWDEILNFVWHFQDSWANHVGKFGLFTSMPKEDDKTS